MTTWSDGTIPLRCNPLFQRYSRRLLFLFFFDLCDCNGRQFDASLIAALESIKNLGNNRGDFFGWRELVESFTDQSASRQLDNRSFGKNEKNGQCRTERWNQKQPDSVMFQTGQNANINEIHKYCAIFNRDFVSHERRMQEQTLRIHYSIHAGVRSLRKHGLAGETGRC
jgi:hypothetical protein